MPRVDIRRAQRISVHEIADKPVRVGRLTDNDLVLRNIHVSRHHCVIEKVDGRLRVRDLDSQSGTFVNGDRVQEAFLYAGDRVSVGPFDLVMRPAPDDADFISRNSALDAALKHVHIDDETGVSVEGPAALVESLQKQLVIERKLHRKAEQQAVALQQQLDDLKMQMAHSERSALLQDDLPLPGEERLTELEQALAQAQQRADDAERDAETLRTEFESEIESLRRTASDAEDRSSQLAGELDALRRETVPSSAAEQLAEMQGLLDIERRRAQTAEEQVERAAARLAEAERLAESADRAGELQSLLEIERRRADESSERVTALELRMLELAQQRDSFKAAAERGEQLQAALSDEQSRASQAAERIAELESQMELQIAELRRLREGDVQQADDLRAEIDQLQTMLREARGASETVASDHHSALQQLQDAESALAQWRERGEQAERMLETERAHAADLNRALEEAWAKIDEAGANVRALEARVEELETTGRQQSERASEAVAAHVAEIERLTSSEASLRRELDGVLSAREAADQTIADLRSKLETAEASLHHALARASELEDAAADVRERIATIEQQARMQAEQAAAELAAREQRIADLAASEESLKQRLNNLEATKYAASQKAERALGTLNLLHGQIRSLDDAAAKVTDLQSRLARIEEAWVAADETLDSVDENDQSQVAAAVEQRQRIVAELDALNKARDAAVSSLRESALRLRSISERETPVVTSIAAPPGAPPMEPTGAGAGAGKKWWKLSK